MSLSLEDRFENFVINFVKDCEPKSREEYENILRDLIVEFDYMGYAVCQALSNVSNDRLKKLGINFEPEDENE